MTMNEKLSAFVDNELSELEQRRLLVELDRDPALRAAWERYHLIGAALRRDLEQLAPADLSARVADAIAGDAGHRPRRALTVTLGRALGGLAIAAAVATVAVLNFPLPFAPSKDTGNVATRVDAPTTAVAARGKSSSAATNPLNAYLVEHNEFAPTAGMGNMLPYVRTVKHDENR